MIVALLDVVLRHRVLVLILAGLLACGGLYAFDSLPVDAFPDVTNTQVQILTQAPGLAPTEVERFVTYPIELQLMGIPGLTEVRSLSKFALSQVTVVFEDAVDIYFARQLVLERLVEVRERLPSGLDPVMAPVTTGLGEIYQYYLDAPSSQPPPSDESSLTSMRTVQDWVLRPLLKTVPGVIEVNAIGGFVKQYQILVDAAKLRKYDLDFQNLFKTVARNNQNVGGNILERHAEKYLIQGIGLLRTTADIENIVVKETGGIPVFLRDVAEVRIGHAVRHGAAVLNGEREVVAGIILMLRGANARTVVEAVKERIEEIHRVGLLPDGLRLVPFYDRSELVTAALATVMRALIEGGLFVTVVVVLFLGRLRSALVVIVILVVAPLTTFIAMRVFGLSANVMSLGGLAISLGMIVDPAIIQVENVERHFQRMADTARGSIDGRLEVVRQAVLEVRKPSLFGELIIALTFVPLLSLVGMEGKLFTPLALTIMLALLVSLVLSFTLAPVLCFVLVQSASHRDTALVRWVSQAYEPVLRWSLAHRGPVLSTAAALFCCTIVLVPFLGTEFIPIMDEGAITPQTVRLPSIALAESVEVEKQVHRAILEFPQVHQVVGKIGRSEIANDPQEPNESDPVVTLHPRDTWPTYRNKTELVDAMRRRLAEIPGVSILMSQPIQGRVDELISGVRTEVSIKLFGDDLEVLREKAEQTALVMKTVAGVQDIKVEQIAGQPYLNVTIDRHKIARHGLNVSDVQEVIASAIGGQSATYLYEDVRRFQLILRLPEDQRNSVRAIRDILIRGPAGAVIPLSELATVDVQDGPVHVSREHAQRRIFIGFNVEGRDIGSVVAEGQRKLAEQIHLPDGYRIVWSGAFENMQRALARLQLIVPVTIVIIFFLLFSTFGSVRSAALVLMNLPLALIGGVLALWITGQYLSVPAAIGFIALFGVAVLNGIVLVSYINHLRSEGQTKEEAVINGCRLRLRPVLMTALVALLGLLPMAFAQGIGAEVQRPLATVVIGGLVSSTFLTLIVLPVAYLWFSDGKETRPGFPQQRRICDDKEPVQQV